MRLDVIVFSVLLSLTLPVAAQSQQKGGRILFDEGWRFHQGDVPEAVSPAYSDSGWRRVTLPHDWSIEGPFGTQWASATGFLPGGVGWYRKSFRMAEAWKGRQCFIYFDGVYKNSEVWINGHYLGKRPSGFASFEYDLTPYLNPGGLNVLSVRADHSQFADSRWYTGSGIYRDVYLEVRDPVYIGLWGATFQADSVSSRSAIGRVKVDVVNSRSMDWPVSVEAVLTDENGKPAARAAFAEVAAGAKTTPTALSFLIAHPRLWSISRPSLYRLTVTVSHGRQVVDKWSGEVGVRSCRFDPDAGFFLNGNNIKLKGVCVHDDAGVLGVAVPREVWIRRLRTLKKGGCNALRLSHNPHADYLYSLCDEMGFLVMDEAYDEWETGKNKWIKGWNQGTPGKDGPHDYFGQWGERDLEDMIRRDRNHPSVFLWSIGNEIDYPNDPYSDPVLDSGRSPQIYGSGYLPDHPKASRLGEIAARLVSAAKQEDTTRPVTAALAGVVMSNTTTYPESLDVVGYNYQEYRYRDDHKKYPQRVIYGSENGMSVDAWNAVDSNRYISGQFLWTGIDYLGEANTWPNRANGDGLLTLAGFAKPEYYFRQSLWADIPMVYMLVSPAGQRDRHRPGMAGSPVWEGPPGDSVVVSCFTNCDEAELFLNHRSLGKQRRTDAKGRVLVFHAPAIPGQLTLKGYQNGRECCSHTLYTPGKASAIQAVVYKDPLISAGDRVQQIEVALTDKEGHLLYHTDQEVKVTVTGAARLMGIENGDLSDTGDYHSDKRRLVNGRLLVLIHTSDPGGLYRVQLTVDGLPSVVVGNGF